MCAMRVSVCGLILLLMLSQLIAVIAATVKDDETLDGLETGFGSRRLCLTSSVCHAGYGQNPSPGQNPPYDRALMSTTGYCIAYEKA